MVEGVEFGVPLLQLLRSGSIVGLGLLGRRGQSFQVLEPQGDLQPLELLPQGQVLPGLLGLDSQRLHLQLQFGDFVVDTQEVFLGGGQPPLRLFLPVPVFGNAGGLLEDFPAVRAFDGQDLIDPALADVGVALLAQARVHEHLVDVPQAGGLAVNIVFAFAGTVIPARDHHFRRVHREAAVLVVQNQRRLGKAHLAALLGAAEDHILHLRPAQRLGTHLAHDPADGVGNIRFAAAVGADDGGDVAVKPQDRLIRKGFEALDF